MHNINLYPHNQQAYEKVMAHYADGHRRAAVVQPTGTGKSYMGGAVASHFKRVLIVAPNDYVLSQAKATTPHAECVTYSWVSMRTLMPRDYNLIWFDEFHRIGAETWCEGVIRLMDANPDAKILGTTATEERSLEQRNMADEMFSGDVVSHMTITDAWVRQILQAPTYVIGVISMDDTKKDYRGIISRARRLNAEQKTKANTMLDNLLRDWSRSSGVPRIMRKYIDHDVKRMIVFAQTIEKLNEVKSSLPLWFREAGLKLANVYEVHSAVRAEAKANMKAFEQDQSDGIKVLISVDMLNEGIHVEGVDACMLLRSTISKNLYLQQIGRCFAVGQKHKPVVLDLADNITSACGYDGIYVARDRYIHAAGTYQPTDGRPDWADDFLIIDTLKHTRELMSELDKVVLKRRDFDDDLAELTAWCEANNRLPENRRIRVSEMTDEQRIERRLMNFVLYNKDREPIIALYERYKKWCHMTMDQRIQAVVDFVNVNNRLPASKRKRSDGLSDEERAESNMRNFMRRWRNHPVIAELFEAYRKPGFEEKFASVEQFVRDHGRLPICARRRREPQSDEQRTENELGDFLVRNGKDQRIINLRLQHPDFRTCLSEKKQRIILEWCESHGTYPISDSNDKEQKRYASYIRCCGSEEFLQTLRDKYGYKSYAERMEDMRKELIDYCETHGRLPRGNGTDPTEKRLYKYYYASCRARRNFSLALREKYVKRKTSTRNQLIRDAKISCVIEFITTHKRLPYHKSINPDEGKLRSYMYNVRDDDRVAALVDEYSNRNQPYLIDGIDGIEETRVRQLREFVQANGYLPVLQSQGLENILATYFSRTHTRERIPEVKEIYSTYPRHAQYKAQQRRQHLLDYIRQHGKPTVKNKNMLNLYYINKTQADVLAAMEEYNSKHHS